MRSAVEAPDEPYYIILIDLSAQEILFCATRNTGLSGMKVPKRAAKPVKAHRQAKGILKAAEVKSSTREKTTEMAAAPSHGS